MLTWLLQFHTKYCLVQTNNQRAIFFAPKIPLRISQNKPIKTYGSYMPPPRSDGPMAYIHRIGSILNSDSGYVEFSAVLINHD